MSIVLENIIKQYGEKENIVTALNKICLEIQDGEFVAIMGTSGAGKTTLLNIIGCIDVPSSGKYLLAGKDISKCKDKELSVIRNQNIGFVLQDFGLIGHKTVFDNVAVPLLVGTKHYSNSEIKKYVKDALKKAGIVDLADKKAYKLSGGQKQRVAIARAMVCKPGMILADEPTGNLDKKTSDMIMEQFAKVNQQGTTVIIVTHDEHVAGYCTRQIQIEDGKLVQQSLHNPS